MVSMGVSIALLGLASVIMIDVSKVDLGDGVVGGDLLDRALGEYLAEVQHRHRWAIWRTKAMSCSTASTVTPRRSAREPSRPSRRSRRETCRQSVRPAGAGAASGRSPCAISSHCFCPWLRLAACMSAEAVSRRKSSRRAISSSSDAAFQMVLERDGQVLPDAQLREDAGHLDLDADALADALRRLEVGDVLPGIRICPVVGECARGTGGKRAFTGAVRPDQAVESPPPQARSSRRWCPETAEALVEVVV